MNETSKINMGCPSEIPIGLGKIIVGTAIALAVAALDAAPEEKRSLSFHREMIALFLHNFPDETHREMLLANVERTLGYAPDMTDWRRAEMGSKSSAAGKHG